MSEEFGRDQDGSTYLRDKFVFLPRQLRLRVQKALTADSLGADDVSLWLRWGVQIRNNMTELAGDSAARDAVRTLYPGYSGTDQQMIDKATAIGNAWGAVQTRMFNIYPRSANGYLEGYLWSSADVEPQPRTVSPIPTNLRNDLQAFVDAF